MTDVTPDRVARSLARDVRHQLTVTERGQADLVIADFEDALRSVDTDEERIRVARLWYTWVRQVRHDNREN